VSTKVTSVQLVNSTIDSTVIGGTSPVAGTFTTLTAIDVESNIGNFSATLEGPTVASSDNSTSAATTAWAKFGFAVSAAANGYIKLPTWLGGIVIQWGNATPGDLSVGSGSTVTFPLAFPTACFAVVANMNNNIGTNIRTLSCYSQTASNFLLGANGSASTATWIAVGH